MMVRLFIILGACLGLSVGDAGAQTVRFDRDSPRENAVVWLGHCTASLISDIVLLTAAHCVREDWRASLEEPTHDCAGLKDQQGIAHHPLVSERSWTELGRPVSELPRAWFGADRDKSKFSTTITHYALAPCSDLALLKLFRRVPTGIAQPMKVFVGSPEVGMKATDALAVASLSYAGWGLGQNRSDGRYERLGGRISYWSENACFLYAMPPRRTGGQRIVGGDSGSPMMVETATGRVIAGVLFGSGTPDHIVCGTPKLRPPAEHGAYTPTFRPPVPDTNSIDIGAWIAELAADATLKELPFP